MTIKTLPNAPGPSFVTSPASSHFNGVINILRPPPIGHVASEHVLRAPTARGFSSPFETDAQDFYQNSVSIVRAATSPQRGDAR